MTLALDEFLRRFLLHLLPKGFVRIRHFGFLANRRRAALLPLCFQLFDASHTEPEASPAQKPRPLWLCPKCGGPMRLSRDLLLPNSNSVLHLFSQEPLHDTPITFLAPSVLPITCSRGARWLPHTKPLASTFARKLQSNQAHLHSG